MREKETREGHEIVSFLRSAAGKPDVACMRGKAFEHWAHRVLAAGGVFRARWEQDASHKDIQIRFAPSTQRGVVGDLAVLASGVSQLQPLPWDASIGPAARPWCVCCSRSVHLCVAAVRSSAGVCPPASGQLQDHRRRSLPQAPLPDDGVAHALAEPGRTAGGDERPWPGGASGRPAAVSLLLRGATRRVSHVSTLARSDRARRRAAASQRRAARAGDPAAGAHARRGCRR